MPRRSNSDPTALPMAPAAPKIATFCMSTSVRHATRKCRKFAHCRIGYTITLMRKTIVVMALGALALLGQPKVAAEKEAAMKADLAGQIDAMKKQAQVMVDSVFSFGELGFQEFETSKYLTGILEKEGFKIERGVAGIPTAWVASWGSGKPVISLGSDIDDIPQASQKPGVGWHEPLIEGAPGHGEGHNSGVPLNIIAALAVKKVMEREHLTGTIRLWPGVAEELVATKAYYVRDGMFKDVDVCLFAHVAPTWAFPGARRSIRTDWSASSTCSRAKAPTPRELRGAARARWMRSN